MAAILAVYFWEKKKWNRQRMGARVKRGLSLNLYAAGETASCGIKKIME